MLPTVDQNEKNLVLFIHLNVRSIECSIEINIYMI